MDKKELKFQYKNTPRPAGVYQIRNKVNNKALVGSSLNLAGRQNRFDFEMKQGCISTDLAFRRDWEQHGPESFSFEVLEELKAHTDPRHDYGEELATLEQKWLEKLQPYDERGYNRRPAV